MRYELSAGILSCLFLLTGCGNDGAVSASGTVTYEGEAVSSGTIMFVPVDEGARAASMVIEQGVFALHTRGDFGAIPGNYKVIFRTDLGGDRLSPKPRNEKQLPNDTVVIYHSPRSIPLTIPETGIDNLIVDIDKKKGWTRILSD